ncbi:MAG: PIN domain-containing protein [Flavisolibacter sp.]|nr:PIN domain-containing protein [Flavisolibacter sp.]
MSVITALKLVAGAKSIKQLASLNKILKVYAIFQINEDISAKAFQLYRKYILKHNLKIPDCFITATAFQYNLQLYTDNRKDFDFIK